MSGSHGSFVWYELLTTDPMAAEAFYCSVIGWNAREGGVSDRSYTVLSVNGTPAAGLMAIPAEARATGARPGWIGYVAVDDVDAYASRVAGAGGAVHRQAEDVPGVGRFAVVADPQRVPFVLFRGTDQDRGPQPAPGTPGHTGWHELHADDQEAAFAFYSGLFGWTKAEALDMGPMGTYQIFAIGGVSAGGMMKRSETTPGPFWLFYVNIDAIDAAANRVRNAGGQVVSGPHQVPGGSWIIHCIDPQGAPFALVGPR